MIEQVTASGDLFLTDDNMMHKKIKASDVSFGPYQEIIINRFKNNQFTIGESKDEPLISYTFLGGVAYINSERHLYLIKHEPIVTHDEVMNIDEITIPKSITGYPYEQKFTYIPELIDVLRDLPATYTDRMKRPINYMSMRRGFVLPVSMDMVVTRPIDLVPTHFAMVCQLKGSPFAVVDIEPGYTDEDIAWLKDYKPIYEEETPRGGKHLLFYCYDTATKYRVNNHCEIIVNTMITFYGINPVWHGETQAVSFPFEPLVQVSATPLLSDDIDPEWLEEKEAECHFLDDTLVQLLVDSWYNEPLDGEDQSDSRLDFRTLARMYHRVKHVLPPENKAWVLVAYTQPFMPHREKHNTRRRNLPYLVYLATLITKEVDYGN